MVEKLVISTKVLVKLAQKHDVRPEEIEECFANRDGSYLTDLREEHQSDPPTLWFVAETNRGRRLKVIFIPRDGKVYIRSAFPADALATDIYNRNGRKT